MKKREKLTAAEKKIKRRKVWGIICISLGAFMLVEGLVLGLVLKETAILLSMGIEGAILLAVGILLKAKNKVATPKYEQVDDTENIKDKNSEKIIEADKALATYKLIDITDEKNRIIIYEKLDNMARIYNNFFKDSNYANNLRSLADAFSTSETKATKDEWLAKAYWLEVFSQNELAKDYREAFIDNGAKKIRAYFENK